MATKNRTFEIAPLDGFKGTKRPVTIEQYRAEIAQARTLAAPIMAALRSGNLEACGAAQDAFRAKFQK